jgi:hypothetical protein
MTARRAVAVRSALLAITNSTGAKIMSKYFISGGSDDFWTATKATTLTGAKIAASRAYQAAVGGKIEIAELHGVDATARYERVAVKHGFNAWVRA